MLMDSTYYTMIESITIANIATYVGALEELAGLSKFNFLYGSNGTGKTTVSRVIANEKLFPSCKITWKGGTQLQPMVYNHDFVDRNFHQPAELKGVFTLGEKQKDTLTKIETAKAEQDALTAKIENLNQALTSTDGTAGKNVDLAALESVFKEKCWTLKQKLDGQHVQGAFKGHMGSKDSFRNKILQEYSSNAATLLPPADLEKKAESIFGPTPTEEAVVPAADTARLLSHEADLILKKRVIGKDDVDIAAMIKKLGNSDWVREGRAFYDVNEEVCPFCQQETTAALGRSLNEYFDEAFVTDSTAVDDLATNYATDATRLQQQLATIIASPSKFLAVEKLKVEKELLDTKITLNNQRIAGKRKEASQVVELESLANVTTAIKTLIDDANIQVVAHNRMVENLATERATLISQVWKFALEELKAHIDVFKTAKDALDNAIAAMMGQIEKATDERRNKTAEIRQWEKQTTSVQPTIDGINELLSLFGFQGFKLAKTASGTSYKLVRADGSDAKATLSEGEKTFVTFLYFYHLLKGSESDCGMTTDRIVVFDDPVSSLDSEILFIVGSLIKSVFDEVRAGTGHIKQVFVLTHNVYFHKEVTFNPDRRKVAMGEETFWVVRKSDLVSKIEKHKTNPIKTSYELLWSEVRRTDRSNLTIQNTLRRILENYFKILGGVDPDKICGMFEGKEKLICKSLFSWVNDGSHFAHDDLYVSIDSSMVETYLKVFREIFKKSDHLAHYKMMMADAYVEESVTVVVAATIP
jgi:wobble nucleotide-excising tRNase